MLLLQQMLLLELVTRECRLETNYEFHEPFFVSTSANIRFRKTLHIHRGVILRNTNDEAKIFPSSLNYCHSLSNTQVNATIRAPSLLRKLFASA